VASNEHYFRGESRSSPWPALAPPFQVLRGSRKGAIPLALAEVFGLFENEWGAVDGSADA